MLTGVVTILVAQVTKGWISALLVLAGVIAIQQLEGHVLQPLLLGSLDRVHALAVVLAVSSGAVIGGVAAALIAVPLVVVATPSWCTSPAVTTPRYRPGERDA
jgi:putative heme transporter